MGIASAWPTKEAPITPRLPVTDRSNCVGGPAPSYHHSRPPLSNHSRLIFLPCQCKEGCVGETPHSVIKEPGLRRVTQSYFSIFLQCFTMGDIDRSQIARNSQSQK